MSDHLPAPLVCLDCEARLQYGDSRIRFHGFVGQHMCGEAQAGHVGQVVPRSVAERLEQSKIDARQAGRAEVLDKAGRAIDALDDLLSAFRDDRDMRLSNARVERARAALQAVRGGAGS